MALTLFFSMASLLILASASDYSYISNPETYGYNPIDNGYGSKPNADESKPEHQGYNPKQKSEEIEHPFPVSIEGLVLCKAGLKYYPIQGAIVRLTCLAVDEHAYWKKSVSIRSTETDSKGYYLTKLSPTELTDSLKLKECKAFLENSPSQTCTIPLDVNHYEGVFGAHHISYSILHDKKMKLYSLRPFFFTSSKPESTPNGY